MKQPKVSDVVVRNIEALILEGTLCPGEKLPPERELAKRMEVSRPSLREALQKLEARGLVESRRGGGTYVANMLGSSFTNPLINLFKNHPETLYDLVEMRRLLEGQAAWWAAARGTDADREIIQRRYQALLDAQAAGDDALGNAELDLEFHLAIAEAAHNVVQLYVMRGLFNLLLSSIYASLEKLYSRAGHHSKVREQHEALYQAIMAQDPEAARDAAHAHLDFVATEVRQIDDEGMRLKRSQRRLYGFAE